MNRELGHEQPGHDVSAFLLELGESHSVLYESLMGLSRPDVLLPEEGLTIHLDLTSIEDPEILERITGDVKFLLENPQTSDKLQSVHLKIRRSQMNRQITNYRMAFPSKYEVIEDEPLKPLG